MILSGSSSPELSLFIMASSSGSVPLVRFTASLNSGGPVIRYKPFDLGRCPGFSVPCILALVVKRLHDTMKTCTVIVQLVNRFNNGLSPGDLLEYKKLYFIWLLFLDCHSMPLSLNCLSKY